MSFARGWGKDGDKHRKEDEFANYIKKLYKSNKNIWRKIKILKIIGDRLQIRICCIKVKAQHLITCPAPIAGIKKENLWNM